MINFGRDIKKETSFSAPSHSPPTLLYVTMSLDIGGTEKHLSLIAPRLRDLGWHPVIYCLWRRGPLALALKNAGIEVIGGNAPERGDKRWSRDIHHIAIAWLRLVSFVVVRKPKIMHFFLPLAYMLGAPIGILLRAPVKLMSRRSLNIYQDGHAIVRVIEQRLHARMTALLGNSKQVVHELIEREGCSPDKVGLIYNGTDLAAIATAQRPDLKELGIPEAELTLIIVANLIPYKGHADLLNALAEIASELPQSWRLLCVGRDDGCGDQLRAQSSSLGLNDNVLFMGERRDVPGLLKAADIGILSSHQEGFSNAVIESLAAGLPMVVTDVGGNAEAVIHGETGIVVPPMNPPALARAILELALHPDQRKKIGAAARKRAESQFSIESCVERYDRLYRALLDHIPVGQVTGVGLTKQQ